MWGLVDRSWPSKSDNPLITFVDDDSYTHAVIVNAATPKLKDTVTKDKVIGLAFEPLELLCPADKRSERLVRENLFSNILDAKFCKYAQQCIGKYYVGKKSNLPANIFKPYYNFMYSNNWLSNRERPKTKDKVMSLILSNKLFLPGHLYRYTLASVLLRTNLNIHIYGRGAHNFNQKDPRNKGSFQDTEPYDDYLYTIAVENTVSDHYISEKILNPIGCDCIPIYLGASQVETYFGENCCYKLTGDLVTDFNTIVAIAIDPKKYLIPLGKAQQEIEDGKACFPRFMVENYGNN